MTKKSTLVVLGMTLLSLSACETIQTRDKIRDQEQTRVITDKVSSLQKTTADVNSRFSDLETELREQNGKIEVLENRLGQNAIAQEKAKKIADEQNAEQSKRIQILQDELMKIQEQVNQNSESITKLAHTETETPAPTESKNEKSSFKAADDLFMKKEFGKAILAFEKFREKNPKDKKIAEAVYKIGVSFQELGMKEEARTFYEELIVKYPNSPEAKRGKIRLKKLK